MPAGAHRVQHRVDRAGAALLHRDLIGYRALDQAHRHRQVGQRRLQAQRVGAGGRVGLVADPAAAQFVDQAAVRAQFQRHPVLFDHPAQGQRLRGAFQGDHGLTAGVAVVLEGGRDESPPLLAVRAHRAHQPAPAGVTGQPGTPLPVGQQRGGRQAVPGERDDLAVEVL